MRNEGVTVMLDVRSNPSHDVRARLDLQYQPAGDRSQSWNEYFGPTNLASIERLCAAPMRALGYR